MANDKIKNSSNKSSDSLSSTNSSDQESVLQKRRAAVRNILAGGGVAVGAASSPSWMKPVVNTIVTPAHAQTTNAALDLAGNVSVATVTSSEAYSPDSILDFFISSAHAGGSDLAGACVAGSFPGDGTFSAIVEFAAGSPATVTGTVSGGTLTGVGPDSLSMTGTIDTQAKTANGTISNGSGAFAFKLNDSEAVCEPVQPTTTVAPTTVPPTTLCPEGYGYQYGDLSFANPTGTGYGYGCFPTTQAPNID